MHILVVDDNQFDIKILKRALRAAGLTNERISEANNGREALKCLNKQNEDPVSGLPDLVLLDINMPEMDGFETLEAIRKNPAFEHLPVIMMTTSTRQEDVNKSYRLRCNAFHSKCSELDAFKALIISLLSYWSEFASLPRQ